MLPLVLATLATGLFAGAAVYISVVEHPARLSCGPDLALREFGPSYRRAAVMQASLALLGWGAGLVAGWQRGDVGLVLAAMLIGAVVPFTLVVIKPTNERLLDPKLDARAPEVIFLLNQWGRLHAVRGALAGVAFLIFLLRLAAFSAPPT